MFVIRENFGKRDSDEQSNLDLKEGTWSIAGPHSVVIYSYEICWKIFQFFQNLRRLDFSINLMISSALYDNQASDVHTPPLNGMVREILVFKD